VTVTATDSSGNSASDEIIITVVDTTAPDFTFSQHTDTLWPPNHKLVLVGTVSDVSDLVDPSPDVSIQVTSNQVMNGRGDGNTDSDWSIVNVGDEWKIYLRAERSRKQGAREYHYQIEVRDFSGNTAMSTRGATVPGDQGHGG